jgi:hypothetical protein
MKLRVLLILYRKLGVVSLPITLLMWAYASFPLPNNPGRFLLFLILLFWLRTPCQMLIWYLYKRSDRKGLYFFFHFGFSEIQLFLATYLFDVFVLAVLIAFTHFVS